MKEDEHANTYYTHTANECYRLKVNCGAEWSSNCDSSSPPALPGKIQGARNKVKREGARREEHHNSKKQYEASLSNFGE